MNSSGARLEATLGERLFHLCERVLVEFEDLRDSSLVARRIDWQHIVMVASPAYLKAHGTPHKLEDLAGHRAVAFRIPSTGRSRPWQLRQGRRNVEMHPTHSVQLSDTETLGNAALLGMGIAQLPDYTMQDDVARAGPAFGLRFVGRDRLAYSY